MWFAFALVTVMRLHRKQSAVAETNIIFPSDLTTCQTTSKNGRTWSDTTFLLTLSLRNVVRKQLCRWGDSVGVAYVNLMASFEFAQGREFLKGDALLRHQIAHIELAHHPCSLRFVQHQ